MSWQKCPKCEGQGVQPKLRYTFRQDEAASARPVGWETCGVCKGKMIIDSASGLPPGQAPELSVDTSRLLCSRTLAGLKFEGRFK